MLMQAKQNQEFFNEEVEQATVGLLVWNNQAVIEAGLKEGDFYYPVHKLIFAEMNRLLREKGSFQVMDFLNFRAAGLPENLNAQRYIQQCAEMVMVRSLEQAISYRQVLGELSKKRALAELFEEARFLIGERTADEITAWLHGRTENAMHTAAIRSGVEVHADLIRSLQAPKQCYPTGLADLDNAMRGGLYAGYTYGFAGAEKAGKTTLGHTISYNLSEGGHRHLYVALEMGSQQIEARNVARRIGVNSLKFLEGDVGIAKHAAKAQASTNVFYLDAPGIRIEDLLNQVGAAMICHKITGFIIDYWQLVGGRQRHENEEQHTRRVAQSLADYARSKGLWCILLAQLNQEGRLFGGNGLRKACDQLYFINTPKEMPSARWLNMDASRYTPRADVGTENYPAFFLQKDAGPYFKGA